MLLHRDPEQVEALWRLFSHNRAGLLRHVSLESFLTVGASLWYGSPVVQSGELMYHDSWPTALIREQSYANVPKHVT